jgi:hypothetical protein
MTDAELAALEGPTVRLTARPVFQIVPSRPRNPRWKSRGADSEEKPEPANDIDAVMVDSLKVLDPERPIREANC